MAKIDGTLNVGIGWDMQKGFGTPDVSVSPKAATPVGNYAVPGDGRDAFATIGVTAAAALGIGVGVRALQGKSLLDPKELALDFGVGAQLGAGLVSSPQAEAFFLGGLLSAPLQYFNHREDPTWDYRVGMLVQGALSLGRAELGGNPIPFRGYEVRADGRTELNTAELLGNAATDTACDAAFYSLGNTLSALAQGKTDKLADFALIGAYYGASTAALTNLILGAPMQVDMKLLKPELDRVGLAGGPDVSDMVKYTTFRTGGLLGALANGYSMTVSRNVMMNTKDAGNVKLQAHELVHRDQAAGGRSANGPGYVREGQGALSFYTQYFADAISHDYYSNPAEVEAYKYVNNGKWITPQDTYKEGKPYGDYIAGPLLLLGFGAMNAFMGPHDEKKPAQKPEKAPDSKP